MYLNLIAETQDSAYILTAMLKNIRSFEVYKKGVINSLIAK